MAVGFVNSGMMKVRQAISVILGALIGTSVTGWIICLSSLEGLGGWVSLFFHIDDNGRSCRYRDRAQDVFKEAVEPPCRRYTAGLCRADVRHAGHERGGFPLLRESEGFIRLLTTFSNPLIGILVGVVFTSVLQSASAAVGILQALSMTGAVSFSAAYPIVLGIAIGAAVPVLLSSLGAKVDGKRTALAYLVIEIIGVVICAAAFYGADFIFDLPVKSRIMTPVSIATVNSLFRIATTLVLLPFIGVLEQIVTGFIKESEAERNVNAEFDRLDERFPEEHPALAIEQCRLTINPWRGRRGTIYALR